MDHKTWLWRKRSLEKMIGANESIDFSTRGNNEVTNPTEKEVDLEKSVNNLNEKLATVLSESAAKDELVTQHVQMEKEAIEGMEKAEAEAVSLKKELDEVSRQRAAANERLTHLNAALKESMKQLSVVREEHEQRIRDAVMTTSRELEKSQIKLEEKYTETSRKLASLTVENTQLSRRASQAESEFNTLMARFDSTEKENAFLKYEFRVLERELEIRNEEIKFNRQSADALHKQHMESVKCVTKLEAECQRLRVLLRRRPGPAALAKRKSEVEMLGRNQPEMRRKRNPIVENTPETPSKKIGLLIERLCNLEDENKFLKEIVVKKDDELHCLRSTCAQPACFSPMAYSVDVGNDDKSSSRSWTSARISEPHGTSECKTIGVLSDISLMDDFVEMEKLAIVSVDSCSDATHALVDFLGKDSTGKELVPVVQIGTNDSEREFQCRDTSIRERRDWLQDVLDAIMDQNRLSKRSINELLEDIRMGLSSMNHSSAKNCDLLPVSGYITWKSPNSSPKASDIDTSVDKTIESLKIELEGLRESKAIIEDQIENQKLINVDLDTELTVSKARLNEVLQKLSSVEVELEDKRHCCEELEAACLDLQLQLESVTSKGIPENYSDQEGRILKTGLEITVASAKLEECQKTILQLGKQLKVLTSSPKEAAKLSIITRTDSRKLSQRSTLRERMLAEDDNVGKKKNEISRKKTVEVTDLAIVPSKKLGRGGGGGGFLRKLLLRKKRGNTCTNKSSLYIATTQHLVH